MNEKKRYELAIADSNELKEALKLMDFKEGSWQKQYDGRNVMSKCIPLIENIELHITFDIDSMKWDDYEDTLVLDDDFCQAYSPFYNDKMDFGFPFLAKVVRAYNNVMDRFVDVGLLKPMNRVLDISGLVRDFIPHDLEMAGYDVSLTEQNDIKEQIKALAEKLSKEALAFKEDASLGNFIDILELVDVLQEKSGYKKEDMIKLKKEKAKVRGSYRDCKYITEVKR